MFIMVLYVCYTPRFHDTKHDLFIPDIGPFWDKNEQCADCIDWAWGLRAVVLRTATREPSSAGSLGTAVPL